MLDIQVLRDDPTPVIESIEKRGQRDKLPLIDEAKRLDEEWRNAKGAVDDLRRQRNTLSERINTAKKAGEDAAPVIAEAKELPERIKAAEEHEEGLRGRLDEILRTLPSPLHPDVPEGGGEEDNVTREEWGERKKPHFDPKSHVELAEELGIADFDAAREVAGKGFFYLKGDLALLDVALQRYALDIMLDEGFTPVIPPYMTRHRIAAAMTDLAWFDETMFKVEGEDLYPIPTSEFPLVGMYVDGEVDVRELPVLLCGVSPCFRKELGSHGVDEKGLFRTHQFHKIEQVVICRPEDSREWWGKLLGITKRIFTNLGLPWRELEMCAGDLGDLKERMADLEVWSPRRDGYFEVGSCSNLTTFQARRLNLRMVHPDGTREFPHTLNNTALATSRAMVAILEYYQQEDGSVLIPEKLRPYMNGKERIGA